jgi:hypothetical protein
MTVITIALFASSAAAKRISTAEAIEQVAAGYLAGPVERTEITTSDGDIIAHYTATLIVDGGYYIAIDPVTGLPDSTDQGLYYDKIRIHRVVKEKRPGVIDGIGEGILCSGGDISDFNLIYMPSTLPNPLNPTQTLGEAFGIPEHSLGLYLAKNRMDVWGIDWRWATIPLEEAPVQIRIPNGETTPYLGLNYMNTDTHLDDFELTLDIARATRHLTGQGGDKMYVTGHSRGGYMAVALANRQVVDSPNERDIKGIIPVDFPIKSGDPLIQQTGCDRVAGYAHILTPNLDGTFNGGVFYPMNDPTLIPPFFNPTGLVANYACGLSLQAPNVDSPIFPGFTNEDVFDVLSGATGFVFNLIAGGQGDWQWSFWAVDPLYTVEAEVPFPYNPYGYGLPDSIGPNPLPLPVPNFPSPFDPDVILETNTVYSESLYVRLLGYAYAKPYQSYGEQRDSMVVLCDGGSPYDENLSSIDVPVLMVGCDGGAIAGSADYILSRLGGDENEVLELTGDYVGILGNTVGYGHADPYFAYDAAEKFWQPMLQWIENN